MNTPEFHLPSQKVFYSKVLLFGEYGVINQGDVLSIPCKGYSGVMKKGLPLSSMASRTSHENLKQFADYLEVAQKKGSLLEIDLTSLKRDLEKNNLYFDSQIPQGYGIGSSGALCAAVYDLYKKDQQKKKESKSSIEDTDRLKTIFSKMESYFHGNSSGIDPLICYIGLPLLVKPQTVSIPNIPKADQKKRGAVFLLDSGVTRKTGPLMNFFMDLSKNNSFLLEIKKVFIHHSNIAIKSFLNGDNKSLFSSLQEISSFVLQHLYPMIPKKILKLWRMGLETQSFYLKLCGSGGGGYVLGFTHDWSKAKKILSPFQTELLLAI